MWRRSVLSGAINYISGSEDGPARQVLRLVDRLRNAALPQDRRSAILELSELAKEGPMRQRDIGDAGMVVFAAILDQDRDYEETVTATLELLISICGRLDVKAELSPPAEQRQPDVAEDGPGRPPQQQLVDDRSRSGAYADAEVFMQETVMIAGDNTTAFASHEGAINNLIELLDKDDFHLRFNVIELLTAMVASNAQLIQEKVLSAPLGVTKLVDTLKDSRDIIRNEMLLLLVALSDGSAEICKILAFENTFERLFDTIETLYRRSTNAATDDDEDYDDVENLVVIQDCLNLTNNLLRGTETNQSLFRETGCIPRLSSILESKGQALSALPSQAIRNYEEALETVGLLTVGSDEDSNQNRSTMASGGLLKLVLQIGCIETSATFINLRCRAFTTTVALIRGHRPSKDRLTSMTFNSFADEQSQTSLSLIFGICSNSEHPALRCAAFEVLKEVLHSGSGSWNEEFLDALVDPPRKRANSAVSPMSTIASQTKSTVAGWPESADPAAVFYSSDLICLGLVESVTPKIVRNRLLAAKDSDHGDILFAKCFRALDRAERERGPPEVRIGLLKLLCIWSHGSYEVVSAFLSSANHFPMILELIAKEGSRGDVGEVHVRGLAVLLISICLEHEQQCDQLPKSKLVEIIRNRIGLTLFTSRLDELRASDAFVSALANSVSTAKVLEALLKGKPGRSSSSNGELGHSMWYDQNFTTIFNEIYTKLHQRVLDMVASPESPSASTFTRPQRSHDLSIGAVRTKEANGVTFAVSPEEVSGYKDVIRQQDRSLAESREEITRLKEALTESRRELDRKTDQSTNNPVTSETEDTNAVADAALAEITNKYTSLQQVFDEKVSDLESLSKAYSALEEELNRADEAKASFEIQEGPNDELIKASEQQKSKISRLEQMLSQLELTETDAESEIKALRRENENLQNILKNQNEDSSAIGLGEVVALRRRAEVAEASLSSRTTLAEELESLVQSLQRKVDELESVSSQGTSDAKASTRRWKEAQSEIQALRISHRQEVDSLNLASREAAFSASSKIHDLEQQLLASRNGEAEALLLAASTEVTELKVKIEKTEKEYESLHNSFEESEAKRTILGSKNEELANVVLESRKAGDKFRQEKEQEQKENSRITSALLELRATNESLRQSELAKQDTISTYEKQLADLRRSMDQKESMMDQADEMIDSLRNELTARTEQALRLSEKIQEGEKSAFRGTTAASLQSREESLSDSHQNLLRDHDIESSHTELTKEILHARQEVSRLRDELEAARSLSEETQVRILELDSEKRRLVEDMEKNKEEMGGKAAAWEKSRATLERQLDEIQSVNQKLIDEKEDLISSRPNMQDLDPAHEERIVDLEAQLAAMKSDRSDLVAELAQASLLKNEAYRERNEKSELLKAAETALSEAVSERNELSEEFKVSQELLGNLQKEAESATEDHSHQKERIALLDDQLKLAVEERDSVISHLQDTEEARVALVSELHDMEKVSSRSAEAFSAKCEEIMSLEKELHTFRLDAASLRAERDHSVELARAAEDKSSIVGNELKEANEKLQQVEGETSNITLDTTKTILELENRLAESEKTAEKYRHECDALEAKLKRIEEKSDTAVAELQATITEVDELKRQQSDLHGTTELLRSQLRVVSGERDALTTQLGVVGQERQQVLAEKDILAEQVVDIENMRLASEAARVEVHGLLTKMAVLEEELNGSEAHILDLQREVEEREARLSGLESKAVARAKEMVVAKDTIGELEKKICDLTSSTKAYEGQISELENQLKEQGSQIAERALSTDELSKIRRETEQTLAEARAQVRIVETEKSEKESALQNAQLSMAKLKDTIAEQSEIICTKNKEIGELSTNLRGASTSVEEARTRGDLQVNSLKEQNMSLESTVAQQSSQIEMSGQQLESVRRQLGRAEESLIATEKSKEALRQEHHNLKRSVEELESNKLRITLKVEDLEITLSKSVDEAKKLREQVRDAEQSVERLTVGKEWATHRVAVLEDEAQSNKENILSLSRQIDEKDNFHQKLASATRELEEKIELLEEVHRNTAAQQKASVQRIAEMTRLVAEYESKARDEQKRMNISEAALNSTIEERTSLDARLSRLQAESYDRQKTDKKTIESLHSKISDAASERKVLLSENDSLSTELRNAAEKMRSTLADKEVAFAQVAVSEKELADLGQKISSLESEIDTLKKAETSALLEVQRLEECMTERENRLRAAVEQEAKLKNDLLEEGRAKSILETGLQEARHRSELLDDVQSSLANSQDNVRALENDYSAALKKVSAMEADNKALRVTVEGTRESRESLEIETGRLKVQIQDLTDKVESLTAQVEQRNAERSRLSVSFDALRNEFKLLEEAKSQVDSEKSALVRRVSDLEGRLEELLTQLGLLETEKQRLEEASVQHVQHEKELRELTDKKDAVEAELLSAQEALEIQQIEWEESLSIIQSALEVTVEERNAAVEQLNDTELLYNDLEKSRAELVAERDALVSTIESQHEQSEEICKLRDEAKQYKEQQECETAEVESHISSLQRDFDSVVEAKEALERELYKANDRLDEMQSIFEETTAELRDRLNRAQQNQGNPQDGKQGPVDSTQQSREEIETERAAFESEVMHLRSLLAEASDRNQFEPRPTDQTENVSESFTKLEQEHADLLVCLAEIELECNSYKERLAGLTGAENLDDMHVQSS